MNHDNAAYRAGFSPLNRTNSSGLKAARPEQAAGAV